MISLKKTAICEDKLERIYDNMHACMHCQNKCCAYDLGGKKIFIMINNNHGSNRDIIEVHNMCAYGTVAINKQEKISEI